MRSGVFIAGLLGLWAMLATATEEPLVLRGARAFSEGLATVEIDGKWGYIDTRGEVVIPAIYAMASGVFDGRVWVIENGAFIVLDTQGRRVAGTIDDMPYSRGDGTFEHFNEQGADGQLLWGFRDPQGKVLVPPRYAETYAFHEGMGSFAVHDASVPETRKRYGYVDVNGNEVIPARYDLSIQFSQGLAMVVDNFRHSFIDKQGNKVFGRDFAFAYDFSEGFAAVDVSEMRRTMGINSSFPGGKWGFIDLKGELVIPAIYDDARPFVNGAAQVRIGTHWGMIDKTGKLIVPARYVQLWDMSEGLAGFAREVDGNSARWGFVNMNGEEVIPPRFYSVGAFSEGFASVRTDAGYGYVDRTGAYLWEPSK